MPRGHHFGRPHFDTAARLSGYGQKHPARGSTMARPRLLTVLTSSHSKRLTDIGLRAGSLDASRPDSDVRVVFYWPWQASERTAANGICVRLRPNAELDVELQGLDVQLIGSRPQTCAPGRIPMEMARIKFDH
jgi:hypothetical protein